MKKLITVIAISTIASSPAFAAKGFMDGVVGTKYAVAEVGSISYSGFGSTTSLSVGGGYQIHPAVAIEVDYLMGGKATSTVLGMDIDAKLTALQVMGVGSYTINPELSAYAKGGIGFNSFKSTVILGGTPYSTSTSSTDVVAAIGIRYHMSKSAALQAQYMETGVSSVNVISFGGKFSF